MKVVEKWLSVEEIAEHLGVSKETIYRWLTKNEIPSHRIGKLWKFKISEVDEWVMNGKSVLSNNSGQKLGKKNG